MTQDDVQAGKPGVLAGLRRPAQATMGAARADDDGSSDLAVLANPDQIAVCGVPGWCNPIPRALIWRATDVAIAIADADAAADARPLGLAPLTALDLFEDLERHGDAARIHLLSFDELTVIQHGSVGIRRGR